MNNVIQTKLAASAALALFEALAPLLLNSATGGCQTPDNPKNLGIKLVDDFCVNFALTARSGGEVDPNIEKTIFAVSTIRLIANTIDQMVEENDFLSSFNVGYSSNSNLRTQAKHDAIATLV